uniref:E3 ubiquitin protein ligase n=1 Tax=Rhizophora mucronata TaxID=61149 RepID=A0A2P2LH56_RHIMU
MENADSEEEPQKKRPHSNLSLSTTDATVAAMARQSSIPPPNDQTVDSAVLQYENQRLVQQLEMQKREMHDLGSKINELKAKQTSYDDFFITVNQLWNQLDDDLVLLGVLAGRSKDDLQRLDHTDYTGGSIPLCPPEEMFLCRLLNTDSFPQSGNDDIVGYVEEALSSRRSFTLGLMKSLEDTIEAQRAKTENIARALLGNPSAEDVIIQLSRIDNMMKEEAKNLSEVIDVLHLKHKEFSDQIQTYINSHSVDESEINSLAGDLEETMGELEETRRKLVDLKMQKDAAARIYSPAPSAVNGSLSPERHADRSKGLRELRDSVEEAKMVAASRLSELQDAREENLLLSKELEYLQNELKDDKHINSSRLYHSVNDQLQHWNAEAERYRTLTASLQDERLFLARREKEVNARLESADAARNTNDTAGSRIEELELQLQKCTVEKNDLQLKLEEAIQDSGRKDIKEEFRVMASALSKELSMMEAQLNRWKQTAHEAVSLRDESQSLKTLLSEKTNEQKHLTGLCTEHVSEIKSLGVLIDRLQKEKLELESMLDMYGQQIYDNRDLLQIKESERRAHAQAEVLHRALDEHSLELRVRAAKEAEDACQERLSAAETEIAELRAELEASERGVLELKEAIRNREVEAEAYISEIETIGQAYEDMQTQNQHLLQQLAERDEYNIKLVSESVKMKQAESVLLSDKQALGKQLQQVSTLVDAVKMRIAQSEEQMKVSLAEAVRSIEEDRHLSINLETARWELMDAEKEMKWLKSASTSSDKEYEQIQKEIAEAQTELDSERSTRNKLEEELTELNNKFAEMMAQRGEAAMQRLQDEINEYKSMLKCSVCSDRPKEVVIVKCYHLFCNPCIQRNLEIRHRKCPACGAAFGQNDVRIVKI